MEFTAADAQKKLDYNTAFGANDSQGKASGAITFVPEGGDTKVTWSMGGDNGANPLSRWLGFFIGKLAGPDFEGGLTNLKALTEKS